MVVITKSAYIYIVDPVKLTNYFASCLEKLEVFSSFLLWELWRLHLLEDCWELLVFKVHFANKKEFATMWMIRR